MTMAYPSAPPFHLELETSNDLETLYQDKKSNRGNRLGHEE